MKKVLFLIDSLPGGGAEKVLIDLVENLDKTKYDVTVMTTFDGGVHVENIKRYARYKSIFKDLKPAKNISHKIYNKLNKKIRELFFKYVPTKVIYNKYIGDEYEIEIAFLEGHATKVLGASTNLKSKKYAWVHIDLLANNWPKRFYNSLEEQIENYKKFEEIYCVSNNVTDAFKELTKIEENVYTMYNPVNEVKIRQLALEMPDTLFEKDVFNIITVGRLTAQKGYDRLLEVHKQLVSEGIKYHLYILGEGEDRVQLEEYMTNNALSDTVTLLGFHKNPYNYMKQADLFVCSSRSEGFSTVATEATILGIPIVTTDCSGMKELLGDSEYGLITDNDSNSLYEGLKKVLTNEELFNHYKVKIEQRSADFTLKQTMRKIESIFER
ncbi:MAG: glycosyltransferase [Turicibacter sp.]|nr:glycosyltransferase [Turicibacter sp.]